MSKPEALVAGVLIGLLAISVFVPSSANKQLSEQQREELFNKDK